MKRISIVLSKFIYILALSVLSAIILMIIVYLIPVNGIMKSHASTICDNYHNEGTYPYRVGDLISTREDNFTDSTMILTAIDNNNVGLINKAIMNYNLTSPDSKLGREESLVGVCEGADSNYVETQYGRYWHGYLVWLKPLLFLFPASTVQLIIGFLDLFLLVFVCAQIKEKVGNMDMIILFISLMIINPLVIGLSFQLSSIYIITMVSLLILCNKNGWIIAGDNFIFFFEGIGIAVAFFDLLTYPLTSWGIPVAIMLILNKKNRYNAVRITLVSFVSWMMGYALMWTCKWITADVFCDSGMIKEAIGQLFLRSSHSNQMTGQRLSVLKTWYNNICAIFKWPYILLFLCFVVILIIERSRYDKRERLENNGYVQIIISFIIIAIMPFAWMAFTVNHSYIHCFFVYRILSVTVFAALYLIYISSDCIVNVQKRIRNKS